MGLEERTRRRCVPVRLAEIPVDVRLSAARRAVKTCDVAMREEVLYAAVCPSDTVYWVAESARPLLHELGVAA